MKFQNSFPFQPQRFFIPPRIALVAAAFGAFAFSQLVPPTRAQDVAVNAEVDNGNNSYRLFYDKLGDDGEWFQTQQYGYVYQPRVVTTTRTWRPYTDGYWARTDAGWTWVSNEHFGWACYHYGRWANVVDVGWVWVPGGQWSPGNVSWRVSNDHRHVGWAPLPPEARYQRGEEVGAWVDTAYDIGPESYVFIETTRFNEPSYVTHVVPLEQNVTIITTTVNVTQTTYRTVQSREVIYDGGPDETIISTSAGRPVRRLDLELQPQNAGYFEREDYRNITNVNGNRLVVAEASREVITSNTFRTSEPPRVARRLDVVNVDRGYRGIGSEQEIEKVRTALRTQSPPPPPQIEQRAAEALRKNGTKLPPLPPANAPGAPTPATANATPGVPPIPRDRNGRPEPLPPGKPGASPGTPVAARPGAPGATPGESPVREPNEKRAGNTPPEPGANPAVARPGVPPGGATPKARPDEPEKPGAPTPKARPEETARPGAPSPATKDEKEERPTLHPHGPDASPKPEASARPEEPGAGPRNPAEPERAGVPKSPIKPHSPPAEPADRKEPGEERPAKPEEKARPNPPAAAPERKETTPEKPRDEEKTRPEAGQHKEPAPERPKPEENARLKPAEPSQPKEEHSAAKPQGPEEKKPSAPEPKAVPEHHNPEANKPAEHEAKPEGAKKEKPDSEEKKGTPKP